MIPASRALPAPSLPTTNWSRADATCGVAAGVRRLSRSATARTPVPASSRLRYVAKYDGEEALFCMCKRTGTPPFCDGTHANLPGGYEVESAEAVAASTVPWAPEVDGGVRRLDAPCYTIRPAATRPANPGAFWMRTLVDAARGAAHQTQVYLEVRDRRFADPVGGRGLADHHLHRRRHRLSRDRHPAIRGRSAGRGNGACR